MTIFDFVLILILAGFVWFGFWAGLIKTLGSLIGVFAGTFFAGIWYDEAAVWVKPFTGGNELAAQVVGFILVFLIASQLVGIVFAILNKIFKLFSVVPGLMFLNRLAGGILGFIEGTFVIGIILQFAGRLPLSPEWTERLADSAVVSYFVSLSGWLVPLFPKALESAKTLFV